MTIHHNAILKPYKDEMLHASCVQGDMCRDCRERAWLENEREEIAQQEMQDFAASEDALDRAQLDNLIEDRCIDCMQDPCTCAPDTHRETFGFAYCAR